MSNHCVYFDGKKRTLLGQSSGSHPPATVFRHLDATEQHNSFFVMFFYLLLQYHCHETQGTQSDFDHYWTHRCELHLQCQASTTDGRCLLCVQAFMHYCISIVHILMEWKVQVRLQRCFLCEFATAFFCFSLKANPRELGQDNGHLCPGCSSEAGEVCRKKRQNDIWSTVATCSSRHLCWFPSELGVQCFSIISTPAAFLYCRVRRDMWGWSRNAKVKAYHTEYYMDC